MKSQFYLSFWRSNFISCERVAIWRLNIVIVPQCLTSNVHFVRKGCDWHLKIAILPQFLTSNVHFVQKGCGGYLKIAILPQFLKSIIARKGCGGYLKIAILPQFWRSTSFRAKGLRRIPQNRNFTSVFDVQRPFVRKGCGGDLKIVILPRFWKSEVHEMLCLSRFAALRRHRPRLKREIERRASERKEERKKIYRCEGARK